MSSARTLNVSGDEKRPMPIGTGGGKRSCSIFSTVRAGTSQTLSTGSCTPRTGQNIGHFLEAHSIFIDMHGRYLGEIAQENRLLCRRGSPHRSSNYGHYGNYGNVGNYGNPGNYGSIGMPGGFDDIPKEHLTPLILKCRRWSFMYDVAKLKTVAECRLVMKRARQQNVPSVYDSVFRRMCQLVGSAMTIQAMLSSGIFTRRSLHTNNFSLKRMANPNLRIAPVRRSRTRVYMIHLLNGHVAKP